MPNQKTLAVNAVATTVLLFAPLAHAQFAAAVSPPRFELSLKPAERTRQVIEITNSSGAASTYQVRTADWTLGADGGVSFFDELQSQSCRPWVAIERREITVPPGGRYRFRFEVAPPADAVPQECRFAVLIEGAEQIARTADDLMIPVSGRIGVIVYASIGDAAPDLQVIGAEVADVNGQATPVLKVNNLGNAHGRVGGFLRGTDALGRRLEFYPSALPILPYETRAIVLTASDGPGSTVEVAYPVTISGQLDWGTASRLEINQLFER